MDTILWFILQGVVVSIAIFFIYIKIRYPFWGTKPVLHTYDWRARLFDRQPRIPETKVSSSLYMQENKTVWSVPHDECPLDVKQQICQLLVGHYIATDRITYTITPALLDVYFSSSPRRPILTLWRELKTGSSSSISSNKSSDETGVETKDYSILGCICSRGVYVRLREANASEEAFYFDFICVKRGGKTIKPQQLFEIHEWRQRRLTLQTYISVFRRNDPEAIGSVIPLVSFSQSTYYLPLLYRRRQSQSNKGEAENNEEIKQLEALPTNFRVRRIETDDNIHFLQDFIETLHVGHTFAASVFAPLPSLFEWIKHRQLMVCALQQYDHLYALYFFQNANTKYDDLESTGYNDVLHLVASYSNMVEIKNTERGEEKADALFFLGFQHALQSIVKERASTRSIHLSAKEKKERKGQRRSIMADEQFGLLSVDEIGHNRKLIPRWEQSCSPLWRTPSAYYVYNYVCASMPYESEECFVLL